MTEGFRFLASLRAAVTFLTRVPTGKAAYRDSDWRWATAHFPLIGAGLGCIAAATYVVAGQGPVGAVAALAASVALTGAFHEDGLADTADALGGGLEDRDRILEILKDSRVGSYAAVSLIIVFLAKWVLLTELGTRAAAALILAHAWARLPPVGLMLWLPYVTSDARARSRLLTRARGPQFALASAWSLGVGGILWAAGGVGLSGLLTAAGVLAIVTVSMARWYRHRLGGITGDLLGATEQVGEASVLAALWFVS
ncbi:MAG: adenosylcobinamide-GDP ribazoletransferase [Myxococcota bacterium]